MTSTGLSRSRSALLALLLAGALLLCHGVYGAMHLCPSLQAPAHQGHEHPAMETGMTTHDEHPACHLTGTEYFAVLLTAFLGLLLGLLLKGARSWVSVAAPLAVGRRSPPVILHPPRGPTLPALQVFRL